MNEFLKLSPLYGPYQNEFIIEQNYQHVHDQFSIKQHIKSWKWADRSGVKLQIPGLRHQCWMRQP